MSYLYNLSLLLFCLNCTNCFLPKNEKLEVFYVPRTAKFEAELSLAELIDLNNEMISYYCTNAPEKVDAFKKVSNIDFFTPKDFSAISPYIYIILTIGEKRSVEMIVDDTIYLKTNNKVYRMDSQFRKWLELNLPKATLPKGNRIINCQ